MFARRKAARRFTLLLLEDEESYVADWVATCRWPASVAGNWQGLPSLPGRLRLATKSLFFEPDDARVPIVRLEFAAVLQLEAEGPASFVVGVSKVIKMKPNAADVPYVVERGAVSSWGFALTYARLDAFMPLAQEQLVLSRLPAAERLPLQDAFLRGREDAASFDSSRLVEFSERLVWEGPASQLTPLVREPGRLAVTDQRLYFQPLHNISGDSPVRVHPLAAVAAVARRRASLRPTGLELFLLSPALEPALQRRLADVSGPFWDGPSAFFTFRSQADRDSALAALTSQPQLGAAITRLAVPAPADDGDGGGADASRSSDASSAGDGASDGPPAPQPQPQPQPQLQPQPPPGGAAAAAGALLEACGGWLPRVTLSWRRGAISNFDYLLYLNLAAGRSFNDLAQWPVFPWVLADYKSATLDLNSPAAFRDLSKPIGALNPARLEVFKQRYADMESLASHVDAGGTCPPPFMYGTHYSTPGYVMYWLVRSAPGHMLRLQGGRFDAPDRLFNSLPAAWDSVVSATTDVKELIPEFYMPGGDFLVNAAGLALGVRQNGAPVNDVELPPWASSPEDLLAKHRAALEAPAVSASLHGWIDLVFGAAQRGPAAVDAANVFYHLTYEGAVDIDQVTGLHELRALETQINEFGQTPRQLFTAPHPPRLVCPPAPDPATVFAAAAAAGSQGPSRAGSPALGALQVRAGSASSTGSGGGGGAVLAPAAGRAARLKGGSEDAAGGALCLALLSTILAATAAELDEPAAAATAATDDVLQSGLRLSPVSSDDLLSAAPCSSSPAPAPAAGAHGAAASTGPEGPPPPPPQQQQQQGQVGALRGMLSRLGGGAAAAAGSVASAVRSGASSASSSGTGLAALAGVPGLAAGVARSGSSGLRLSLPWMQREFAEGLSLRGGSGSSANSSASATAGGGQAPPAAPAASAAAARSPSPLGAAGGQAAAASAPPPATAGGGARPWPRSLPDRLLVRKSLRLQAEPLMAVAAAAAPDSDRSVLCVAGHAGLLRVLDASSLSPLRALKHDGADLLAIAALPAPAAGAAPSASGAAAVAAAAAAPSHGASSGGSAAAAAAPPLPLVLAGAQSGRVLAYAAAPGRLLGDWEAHRDGVSCLLQLPSGAAVPGSGAGSRLATASWDCSVRLWELGEGRQPWSSTFVAPALELKDLGSGVWALAASASGQLLVSGTEEGVVTAWDLRSRQQVWASQVCSDYVGGLSLLPGGNYVAAATADGELRLLEWRRGGAAIARASCGAPLRCCACDGRLLIAGCEAGELHLLNLGQLTGAAPDGFSLAGPDGLYPARACSSRAPVNCVAVAVGAGGDALVLAAQDDGVLTQFGT